ncbi:MAG: hypothetical protein H0W09_00605 [Solirubrobacterales bacterium]|nr:hypothetical protein [Solirubrobacterales bacterium]
MSADPVRAIADAVLYEGYILWPYRRSALKNRQRWTFGGIYPRAHSEGREDDPWQLRTECLLEAGPGATVDVEVRFLHVVERQVHRRSASGLEPVSELELGGERHLSWEEATERELRADRLLVGELSETSLRIPLEIEAGSSPEELHDTDGSHAGTIVRSWQGLEGSVEIGVERLGDRLFRLGVSVSNETPWGGGEREAVMALTLCSSHVVIRATGGEFVSLTDPPAELAGEAEACTNEGAWPVLVGEPGELGTVLCSPIILEDHPRIAPESPGDLFDGGEIDGMLVLNILSLTEEEKAEMRASDPKAREILDRTEALSEDELMALHGTIREFSQVNR